MIINTRKFFLLSMAFLFCILGCTRDRGNVLMPDNISAPMGIQESVDAKASFEANVLPILTARCAFSGCHGEDPQEGYDYRTYESFIAGGEHGPTFIPGDAGESEIVEEVVEGKMPPPDSGYPSLSDAELQVIINWINQQEPLDDIVPHDHEEEEHVDLGEVHDEDDHN